MKRKYNEGVAESNRRRVKHGATVGYAEGGRHHSVYTLWGGIKNRCTSPQATNYHRYGGRGITMYEEWAHDFAAFYAYVGDRPKGMTLDRIDNNKGYEPGNVRWATRKEQANNRETNVVLTYKGETLSLMQWAEKLGYKYGLLRSRWKSGLRGRKLFAPPIYIRGKLHTYKGRTMTLPEWVEATGINYQTLRWRIKNGKDLY